MKEHTKFTMFVYRKSGIECSGDSRINLRAHPLYISGLHSFNPVHAPKVLQTYASTKFASRRQTEDGGTSIFSREYRPDENRAPVG